MYFPEKLLSRIICTFGLNFSTLSFIDHATNFFWTRDKLLRANFKQQNEFFECLLSHLWDTGQEVTSVFTWDFSTGLNAFTYLTSSVNQDGTLCWFLI